MSADSPRRSSGSASRGMMTVPVVIPPQVVSDRSILDSAIGFINEVTLAHQPAIDPKDTITWARFETAADISDPCFGDDWELEGNVEPPLLLILGYGLGVQVWAIPANGEAVEVLSWRHGIVSALRVLPTPVSMVTVEENERADEPIDVYGEKRPLIALVDGNLTSGTQPQFCAINFVSLKTGAQVKTIKFKNPVIDIMANRSAVVVTFRERMAVFDARTLEDRLSITTCYPSPGINPNPAALGPRWLAYAENKLLHSKHSGGGCDGDGVASYTATVLNASKSLVKGLRELGEHVAAGLTGTSGSSSNSKNTSFDSACGYDTKQSGIVTIIDIKNPVKDYNPTPGVLRSSSQTVGNDSIIAHFIAHSEALVAMEFDNSGMLLVTADRRGHDFHVFRIQPNPVGSSLAAVQHLYILHRGDTSAKVQNITLTLDSRWVAVSTLRGTTHVFPITPYGGVMGVRTHTSLHVVNKLSRFHRSAGLSAEGRSNSPIAHSESTTFTQSLQPYHNSTLPPFRRPTVVMPLAQLRQPFALGSPPGSATLAGVKSVTGGPGSGSQRQRLSSLSDDSGKPLSVCAIFAKSRSWLLDPPNVTREAPHRMQRKAVDSLFVMAGHGALIQYDLDTKLAANVAKEKICDDTAIELEVEAKAQWNLGRRKEGTQEITPPLSADNWLIKNRDSCMLTDSTRLYDDSDDRNESWLAQVEIITHAGPHRRLWMGPQFVFKTYNTPSGSNLSHVDIEAVEIGTSKSNATTTTESIKHSSPLNMPLSGAGRSSAVPVLIESGSYSSIEQSPKLMDRFRHDHLDSDFSVAHGDSRLKEDLADAMRESPSAASSSKDSGGHGCESAGSSDNVAFYDALTTEDDQVYINARSASAAALASVLPNIHSYDNSSSYECLDSIKKPKASIEKIVNPLGTVTTVTSCLTTDVKRDILDEVVSQLATEDMVIHENCDESLFRPVVAIFCDKETLLKNEQEARNNNEQYKPPKVISSKLVVPVIEKEINDKLSKREKEKTCVSRANTTLTKNKGKEKRNFGELSSDNKKAVDCDMKSLKKIDLKENFAASLQTNEQESSLPLKSSCENKPECSKNALSLKEGPTEIKSLPEGRELTPPADDLETELHTPEENKDTHQIQSDDQSKEVKSIKTSHAADKFARSKIQQKIDVKRQPLKKLKEPELIKTQKSIKQNSSEANSESDIMEKSFLDKDTTKTSYNLKGDSGPKIKNTVQETRADVKLTANTPLEANRTKLPKNHSNCEKSVSDTEINKNQTSNNLTKQTTAINEKEKQSNPFKETIQTDVKESYLIADVVDNKRNDMQEEINIKIKPSNKDILQRADHFVDKTEHNSSRTELHTKSAKIIDAPQNAKKIIPESTAASNKDNNLKILKSLESAPVLPESSQMKSDATRRDKRAEVKKNDKYKEKVLACDEQSNESELPITSKTLLVDKCSNHENTDADAEALAEANREDKKKSNIISDDMTIRRTKSIEYKSSEPSKQIEACCEGDKVKAKKKMINPNIKSSDSVAAASKPDGRKTAKDNNGGDKNKTEQIIINQTTQKDTSETKETIEEPTKEIKGKKLKINEECPKNQNIVDTDDSQLVLLNPINMRERKCSELSTATKQEESNKKDVQRKETKLETKEIKNNLNSPQKKEKIIPKEDVQKEEDLSKKSLKSSSTMSKKQSSYDKGITQECLVEKEGVKKEKQTLKNISKNGLLENLTGICEKANKSVGTSPLLSSTSAWKTLSGADMINRNLCKSDSGCTAFPLLEAVSKCNTFGKLLPDVPSPNDMEKRINFDEVSLLSLGTLAPLPALEPLQLLSSENNCNSLRDISLINFESPLQETPALYRKITPAPRGFTDQNLILALCGSLHYENEQEVDASEKKDESPTFSSNRSSTAFEDASLADYKSLTENDDPYMSLEQSSQDTNTTTTTNTPNEKFSSSTNSSGTEEIIIMEEKKMTKKQKRKKQQHIKELQKQKEQQQLQQQHHQQQQQQQEMGLDDEELRPLIAMTESEIVQGIVDTEDPLPALVATCNTNQSLTTPSLVHFTTTDSEDPMPATTSDDNVLTIPAPAVHNPHKIKTKKIEHKINLIAAIEAATSSSTSSAEESGIELGGRPFHVNDDSSLNTVSNNPQTTSTIQLPIIMSSQSAVGGLKKKTKRRKR